MHIQIEIVTIKTVNEINYYIFFKKINFLSHNCTLLIMKRVAPKRIHMTEMKFKPQIRYMTLHKLL